MNPSTGLPPRGSFLYPRAVHRTVRASKCRVVNVVLCSLTYLLVGTQYLLVLAQQPKISITSPKATPQRITSDGAVNLRFTVSDPEIVMVVIKISTDVEATSARVPMTTGTGDYRQSVPLFVGVNTIEVSGFKSAGAGKFVQEKIAKASVKIECDEDCVPGRVPITLGSTPVGASTPASGDVVIGPIAGAEGVKDGPSVDTNILVQKKSGIKKLVIEVRNNGQGVDHKDVEVKDFNETLGFVTTKLKVTPGTNLIRVFDAHTLTSQAAAEVVCTGKCGKAEPEAGSGGKPESNITIVKPTGAKASNGLIESTIVVKQSDIQNLYLRVLNENKPVKQLKDTVPVEYKDGLAILSPKIRIGKGKNDIFIFNPNQPADTADQATVTVNCEDNCETSALAAGSEDSDSKITIDSPKSGGTVDSPIVYTSLFIDKDSGIDKIQYRVFREGQTVLDSDEIVVPAAVGNEPRKLIVPVRILEGLNTVTFLNAADPGKREHQASLTVTCRGATCVSDFNIAKFHGSQNSRAIVGLEQAGASSASSETRPFLDLFFNTPLLFSRCNSPTPPKDPTSLTKKEQEEKVKDENCRAERLPHFGAWGQLRFTTTPDQVAAVGVLPSNFVNQLGRASNTVDLVQSFDFLAGLEGRMFSANASFLSLIPGIRQRTHFYLAAGGGAINPLTARRELAQIFKIPTTTSPQRDDFIDRYGTPPTTTPAKEFVGLVPLDRDRFLRQWYLGLRLKTFYCDNPKCTLFKNNFPAIVDFMFGQSEAVTGGSLYYLREDPNDPDKTIKKRSYVLRFDAFYPFPLREANFLYFYGSALMKIGAGGVRIQNPLFLDTAPGDVLITDPRVYIPSSERQKMFQPSRDYYKIGVGINLTELFNRNKNPK